MQLRSEGFDGSLRPQNWAEPFPFPSWTTWLDFSLLSDLFSDDDDKI